MIPAAAIRDLATPDPLSVPVASSPIPCAGKGIARRLKARC